MRQLLTMAAALAATLSATSAAQAATIAADWDSVNGGTLNGVSFRVEASGGSGLFGISDRDLASDPEFSAAPIATAEMLDYGANTSLTFTFESAVSDLLLYAGLWRGTHNGGVDDPASVYTLSDGFEVLSGFTFSTIVGTAITIDDDDVSFEDGILRFLAPITTFTINADSPFGNRQLVTVGIQEVPLPGAIYLFAAGLAGFGFSARKRQAA